MPKKKCPIGLICIDTKYLLIFFGILLIFVIYNFFLKDLSVNNSSSISDKYFSNRFKKKKVYYNDDVPNNSNMINYNYNNNLDDMNMDDLNNNNNYESRKNINNNTKRNQVEDIHINNAKRNQVEDIDINIITQPPPPPQVNRTNYLVNKDYERVVNPLLPPERRNNYIEPHTGVVVSSGVAVNIPTRGFGGEVQQLGMLTKKDGNNPIVLPLFGCPTYASSNRWMYYTTSDKYNQIKIPLNNKNKQCDLEYGCDEINDGEEIQVEPYEGLFKVNIYKYDKPRYLPHII